MKHRSPCLLAGLAIRSETEMSGSEDFGKTLVQSGDATVEDLDQLLSETFNQTYPLVQNTYKVMRYLMQLQDVSRAYLAEHELEQLAAIERNPNGGGVIPFGFSVSPLFVQGA